MSLSTSPHALVRGFACFVAAATLLVGLTAPAHAAPDGRPHPAQLPTPGQTFDLEANSPGIMFTVEGRTVTSPPLRGTLALTIDANPADPETQSVEAKPFELKLSTKAAQTMSVTVDQRSSVVDEQSILRVVQPDPPRYEHVMSIDLRLTVTMVPQPSEADVTTVLETREPALFEAELKSFPPANQMYSLRGPVELTAPADSNAPKTMLSGFDMIVNESA